METGKEYLSSGNIREGQACRESQRTLDYVKYGLKIETWGSTQVIDRLGRDAKSMLCARLCHTWVVYPPSGCVGMIVPSTGFLCMVTCMLFSLLFACPPLKQHFPFLSVEARMVTSMHSPLERWTWISFRISEPMFLYPAFFCLFSGLHNPSSCLSSWWEGDTYVTPISMTHNWHQEVCSPVSFLHL